MAHHLLGAPRRFAVVLLLWAAAESLVFPVWQERRWVACRAGDGDVEAARSQFERLLQQSDPSDDLIMSGTRRRKVEQEMELIEALGSASDPSVAIGRLWKLWFSERGSANQAKLLQVDELIGEGPPVWPQAERLAAELAEEHPDWAEPKNRLATLLYLSARYDESVDLCEQVLRLKPHHFGALSGIVMCHLKRGDLQSAASWAPRQLPPDPANRRRWAAARLADFSDVINPPSSET